MNAALIRLVVWVPVWVAMAGCASPPGPLVRAMERQGLAPREVSRVVFVGPGGVRATYTQVGLVRYVCDTLNAARPCPPPTAEELAQMREIDLYDGVRTEFPVAQLRLAGDAVQPIDQPDRWYRCAGMWDLTGIYLRTAAIRTSAPPLTTTAE